MALSTDIVITFRNLLKDNWTASPTPTFRTSPADAKESYPCVVVRHIHTNEYIKNIGYSIKRFIATLWIYCEATSKADMNTISNEVERILMENRKAPDPEISFIRIEAVREQHDYTTSPRIFKRIVECEVIWEETI